MTIAQSVQRTIAALPAGQVFGYEALPSYSSAPAAVTKAVSRLIQDKKLKRFAKGKFYVPEQGLLGERKLSDSEVLRSVLFKNGRLRGYITGYALYNRLGLTTQMPGTITVAVNGGRQEKDFGNLKVQVTVARAPVNAENVKLLGYLDVLKDIKSIPDANVNTSLARMRGLLGELNQADKRSVVSLALTHYTPQTRALLGLLMELLPEKTGSVSVEKLRQSLNPTTTYKLGLDESRWTAARSWNIR
jgi:hypothetical protein|tara:strand:- start:1305 stop:2042 length:738 start_codon:yes stop_codon:yes gene_type:complete